MFADELRRAAETAARVELPAVSALLWKAFAAGSVTEAEAEALSSLIEGRRAVAAPPRAVRVFRGSKPRTDESLQRRRRWAASGRLPPGLASRFTTAETAVLAVVAAESMKHGRCTMAHAHLAAVAGVSVSSVKRAMRAARDLGLIEIEVRRVSAFRNDTNRVSVVSREWLAWMRLAWQEGGGQRGAGTHTSSSKKATRRSTEGSKKLPEWQGRIDRGSDPKTGQDGRTSKVHVLRA